jgi:hypothetical protein
MGGPLSAPLIPHFGLLPPHAVERMEGRLKNFSPLLKDVLGCTPYALEAVMGFRPYFTSPPPLALLGPHFCTPSQGKNDHFIDQEVEALLSKGAKGAIEPLSTSSMLHQRHFSYPKEKWGIRPILT